MVTDQEEVSQIERMVDADVIYQTFKPAMVGDDAAIMRDVVSGRAWAYQVNQGNITNYWIVRPDGRQLVIVCCVGKHIQHAAKLMYQAAKQAGFTSARFHTQRPGLARLMQSWGPTFVEHVYRVEIE